jgi:hypothetical protein
MDILIILLSGFIATTLMTLFSYLFSAIVSRNFSEPELLNKLISGSDILSFNPGKSHIAGWILHFIVGWAFALILNLMVSYTPVEPDWFTGLWYGAAAGLVGIVSWKIMFSLNEDPPIINLNRYFIHLFLAHIVFGLGMVWVYWWF